MAWTAPRTWVTGETVTASQMNTHVRDNLLETGPAKVTAVSQYLVATGANALINRTSVSAEVITFESTTSTSFTVLTTNGPVASVTTGALAMIMFSAELRNNTAGSSCFVSYDVTGASAFSGDNNRAIVFTSGAANEVHQASYIWTQGGLTPGVNNFRLVYRVSGGTGTFGNRRISVYGY